MEKNINQPVLDLGLSLINLQFGLFCVCVFSFSVSFSSFVCSFMI